MRNDGVFRDSDNRIKLSKCGMRVVRNSDNPISSIIKLQNDRLIRNSENPIPQVNMRNDIRNSVVLDIFEYNDVDDGFPLISMCISFKSCTNGNSEIPRIVQSFKGRD